MSGWQVAPLGRSEARAGAGILARAFRDNPLNRAVIRRRSPRRRERSNRAGLRGQIPVAIEHGLVLAVRGPEGRLAGVLMASPPGGHPLPRPGAWQRLRASWGQGLRVAERWAQAYRVLAEHHPVVRHWYLDTLGVDPAVQGRGAGGALLEAFLGEIESDGLPVFLETDRAENLRFYARAGFAVDRELCVLGTPVWLMTRPPAG